MKDDPIFDAYTRGRRDGLAEAARICESQARAFAERGAEATSTESMLENGTRADAMEYLEILIRRRADEIEAWLRGTGGAT